MLIGELFKILNNNKPVIFINTDIMYDKIMNDFRWGGMDKNPDMYLDETCRRMCSTLRSTFNQLASELIAEGKTEKAQKVLQKCIEVIPYSVAPYEIIMLYVADNFYKCNFIEHLFDKYPKKFKKTY